MATALLGCDFSSSPSRRKPIVVAWGQLAHNCVQLHRLQRLETLAAFSVMVGDTGATPWIGGFDLPFGLPRELVQTLGWPLSWEACIGHYAGLSRAQIRDLFAAFCSARQPGAKFAHRATDRPARSSPSMKWVNPPVAYMLHAGVPRLLEAGVYFPGLQALPELAPHGVALEAYPGMMARDFLGGRSYKSDDRAKQTPERLIARKDLIEALEQGRGKLGLRLKLTHAQRDALAEDASGDSLDSVLCLLQAAWACNRFEAGDSLYGLPPKLDPLEGWIVGAPWPSDGSGGLGCL